MPWVKFKTCFQNCVLHLRPVASVILHYSKIFRHLYAKYFDICMQMCLTTVLSHKCHTRKCHTGVQQELDACSHIPSHKGKVKDT